MFRFEVEYQLRRVSTPIFGVLLAALAVHLNQQLAQGQARHIDSPLTLASATAFLGLFGMLVTAALCADAATRDVATGTHPLIHSLPIRKRDYLGGRFLGALAVNVMVALAIPVGLLVARLVPSPAGPITSLPFQALAYVQPFLLLALPNLFVTASFLFTVAAWTRRALPSYLFGLGLGIAAVFSLQPARRLGGPVLATFLDPFGLAAVREHVKYWTPSEKAVWLLGIPESLLLNRLVWIVVASGVLVLLHWRFRLSHPGSSGRQRNGRRAPSDDSAVKREPLAMPAAERSFGRRTAARQTLAVAASDLREILLSRLFLAVAGGGLFVVVMEAQEVGGAVFETAIWPVTHLMATSVLDEQMAIVFAALIAVFAGELVWRDRDARIDEITASAPVAGAATLLGHFLAILGMIVALQAVVMITGILLQAAQEYYHFELLLYLKILFGLALANHVLFAVLALATHVIVDQKYLGHMVAVLLFLLTQFAGLFGIRHRLLIYGSDGGWVYSDMNGFGPFVARFVSLKLYWAAWALLICILACLFWTRGTERGFQRRLRQARLRFAGRTLGAAAAVAVLILVLGGFVFYNTNVLNDYQAPGENESRAAEYERRYKRHQNLPQPRLVRSELRVEIDPKKQAVGLRGSYRLVNETATAIDSIHVIVRQGVATRSLSLDRPASVVLADERHRYRIHALERPLQPGDSLRLDFDLAYEPRGFPNGEIDTSVAANGAYLDRRWLPAIGYQPAFELTDDAVRTRQGLPPREGLSPADDPAAPRHRSGLRNEDLVEVDAVVGTDEDQIALTPGALVAEWREKRRRYFHYRTEAPLSHGVPLLSARYAVREDRWRPASAAGPAVALKIFYHPAHTLNLDRLLSGMKASLDYYSAHFGPYQFRGLRIAEFPRYASFARSHPHTIAFSEGGAFLTRVQDGDVDRPFFVTAHETAHQWWGGQLTPARAKGAALLSETLAQYSAMMVLEKAYGAEHVRKFCDFAMDYYLKGRGAASRPEVPLLRVEDESHLFYHKGALAMYTLRELIGEERVNGALRRLLERHRSAGPPYPTALDLYGELRSATPEPLQYVLRDLFEEVTLWDVRTESVSSEAAVDGTYRVSLRVHASKLRVDAHGKETEVPMDDLIEIGVFGPAETGQALGEPLYMRRHRIRSGAQSISATVHRRPARAGIDPHRKLIQRKSDDNVAAVELAPPEG